MDLRHLTALLIFALTYVLISARRLRWLPIGRPAGALLGAVLMVALGVLEPEASYAAIDHQTVVLLLGMMLISAYLDMASFFDVVVGRLLAVCGTPRRLLVVVAGVAAVLSAFLVNDAVCLFMTPIVVRMCSRARLPMGPYLIGLATSANIGSAATLVGNPQNMIIGSMSHMPFAAFLLRAGPASLVGLAVNVALLLAYYGRRLPGTLATDGETEPARPDGPAPGAVARQPGVVALVVVGVVVAFFAGANLGYAALAGATALIIFERREPRDAFARVDWTLLVFFCALFVVVEGLKSTGWVDRTWEWARPHLDLSTPDGLRAFSALIVVGSNLVSNVPLVLLTGPHLDKLGAPPALGWVLLAFVSTVAGNLTLIGSVANIIVAEGARDRYTLGFLEYLRFGLVSTFCVLVAGVPVIVLVHQANP
jgi:Na+/H+ antiporter NhaD/arsenite permease-like protein